nr:MATE family efflux transporter [Flavonifractor sp. DFI.6.63]
MTQTPVRRLVVTMAVPTIISMLVTSVYNMADTYFVGKIGTSATAAVGVTLPLMSIFQAIAYTLGQGSGNTVARLLGQKKREDAEVFVSIAFFSAFFCGVIISALGTILLEPLVGLLGATATSAPYASAYIRIILLGAPFIIASLTLNNQFRFQGNAVFGTIGIFAGAIINIVLDPVFIFKMSMGTGGAALATVLSQFLGFCILVCGTFRGTNIRLSFRRFCPTWKRYYIILLNGLPAFWRQALSSLAVVLLNIAGRSLGGDTVVAAMSIVSRVTLFASYVILGLGQGYQPVCGFNYGAGLYERVRTAFVFLVRAALEISLGLAVLGFVFAPQVVALFRRDDLEVIQVSALALRFQCLTFPLTAWITPTNMTLQTTGHSIQSMVLSMFQKGLTFVPLILILPPLLGVFGIQISQSLADIFTFLIALPLGLGVWRELRFDQGDEKDGEVEKIRDNE